MGFLTRVFGGVRTRLVLLGFATATPFIFDQFRGIEADREAALGRLRAETRQIAASGAQEIAGIFDRARMLFIVQTNTAAADPCIANLTEMASALEWAKRVLVAVPTGRVLCSSSADANGISVATRHYFQRAVDSQTFVVSDVLTSLLDNRPTIVTALAARDEFGKTKHVFVASVDLERTGALIADQAKSRGVEIYLLDEDNRVAAQYPRRAKNSLAKLPAEVETKVRGLTLASFFAEDAFGDPRVYAVHYLPFSPARLLIGMPTTSALVAARAKAQTAYLHAAIICMFMLIFVFGGGEYFIVRPIRALTAAAGAIAHGDLTARARVNLASTEFKDLAAVFNLMADRVQRLAGTDTLTAVANRREFDAKFASELSRSKRNGSRLNLALIDVDRFKHFNDSYGHLAGDACLQQVGLLLAEHARRPADIAARFGGDEFALLLADVTASDAAEQCERLRQAVVEAGIAHRANSAGVITLSIGLVSRVPTLDDSPTDFLKDADKALYAAKAAGRNYVYVEDKHLRLVKAG